MSNTYENAAGLYPLLYETIIRRALEEDLGRAGDITTDNVVPAATRARALIVARKSGRIAGLEVSLSAFHMLDADLDIRVEQGDGNDADAGRVLAVVEGAARPILSAERTALNMLGRLCGIATVTADAVAKVNSETTRVICTRKTTPGLRVLEKYAVRMGGGTNHRFGLDDGVLLKDNHIVAAGGIGPALARIRERLGHMVKVEVEVDTLDQLDELLSIGADAVLLCVSVGRDGATRGDGSSLETSLRFWAAERRLRQLVHF